MDALIGKSTAGRKYGKKVKEITASLPSDAGFYLWGFYTSVGLWRSVYLGKAGYGVSTSLRSRIDEELRDERPFAWCEHQMNTDHIWQKWKNPDNIPGHEPSPKARQHFDRSIRKAGSTHVIAVSLPVSEIDNKSISSIEADLIETLNPIANVQRPRPHSSLQDKTIEVIRVFKDSIHSHRPAR
ncbi:hypothetical protein [Paenalcaligenes sp. Me131]|uniref:hypothetical protein n=1 Tax=Paenalcaligenes sp. Me131 TaxID=3392636 RepID=UPI003D29FD18